MSTKEKTKTLQEILAENGIDSAPEKTHRLILWNDDVNSFEWVIFCLMQIMKFTFEKSESTAWQVHLEGSSVLKSGTVDSLKPYKTALEERGLTLSIEKD